MSLPLSFTPLPWWHKSSSRIIIKIPFDFNVKRTTKSHICFSYNNNEREEMRWLREEQRWLREEQRWLREERRWEAEREALLNQIKALKLQIQEEEDLTLSQKDTNTNSVAKLIAETGSSSAPLVLEDAQDQEVAAEEEEEEEVVIKVEEEDKEVKKVITLRAGSEGDQVQLLQEALLKLGFYCGEEDEEFASFSSGTERAVKTWQSSIGVPETGIITPDLLQRLSIDQQHPTSAFKGEGANGVAITQTPEEIPLKQVPEPDVSKHRVFLLGENRWEDSSRLKKPNTHNSKGGVVNTKCITCRGEGRLLCLECDGTGEPNIEPQFLEWIGEDTKCAYCEGAGHTLCDVCQGTGAGAA